MALRAQRRHSTRDSVLGTGDRFWMFLSSNTNTGHFQVHRSEPAFMQVVIDDG